MEREYLEEGCAQSPPLSEVSPEEPIEELLKPTLLPP